MLKIQRINKILKGYKCKGKIFKLKQGIKVKQSKNKTK